MYGFTHVFLYGLPRNATYKEGFWRKVRHVEKDPRCDIGVIRHNDRYFPTLRSLRRPKPCDELTVNFRHVPSDILERFTDFAHMVAKKLSAYDKGCTFVFSVLFRIRMIQGWAGPGTGRRKIPSFRPLVVGREA